MTKWWPVAVSAIAVALFLLLRGRAPVGGGVSAPEAASLIKSEASLQLIDVRTPGEYAAGHLAQAKLIPLQELGDRLGEIDRARPILLYCRSGHRSGQGLKLLLAKGFNTARHMEGGINAWQGAGLPVSH